MLKPSKVMPANAGVFFLRNFQESGLGLHLMICDAGI